jgi:hypothetical protein
MVLNQTSGVGISTFTAAVWRSCFDDAFFKTRPFGFEFESRSENYYRDFP